jgi:lipoprotein signal peptidase
VKTRLKNTFPLTFFTSLVILYFFTNNYDFGNKATCTNIDLVWKLGAFTLILLVILNIGLTSLLIELAAGFILSGGFFIIFEGFVRGCVMDYMSFLGLFRFNFADVLIFSGSVLIIIDIFVKKRLIFMYNQIVAISERPKR